MVHILEFRPQAWPEKVDYYLKSLLSLSYGYPISDKIRSLNYFHAKNYVNKYFKPNQIARFVAKNLSFTTRLRAPPANLLRMQIIAQRDPANEAAYHSNWQGACFHRYMKKSVVILQRRHENHY
jgi:hypothetical protein